jgi:hypothetical protein
MRRPYVPPLTPTEPSPPPPREQAGVPTDTAPNRSSLSAFVDHSVYGLLVAAPGTVRRLLLATGFLVLVQAGVGLVINLYGLYPARHRSSQAGAHRLGAYESLTWSVGHGTLTLTVHAALGLTLVVLSIVATARSVPLRQRAVTFWTALGALLVIGAAVFGGSFLANGKTLNSLLMALFALSAEVCFHLAIDLLPSGRHGAAATPP